MKRFLNICALLLVLCQIIFCFSSCGIYGRFFGEDESIEQLESELGTEAIFEFTKKRLADYVIVVPSQTDEDLTQSAEMLQRMIERVLDVKLEIRKDKRL